MTLYSTIVFVHVLGMLGLFFALGLEGLIVSRLWRTTSVEEIGVWIRSSVISAHVGLASIVPIQI